MTAEHLIGLAAIVSALGQIFEARWGSGRDLRKMVERHDVRLGRIEGHIGLPAQLEEPK